MSIIQNPFYNNIPSYGKIFVGGPQRRKKKQGIPRHPCDSRRKRGCPTAGPPLLSFSCVPPPKIFQMKSYYKFILYYPLSFRPSRFYYFLSLNLPKTPFIFSQTPLMPSGLRIITTRASTTRAIRTRAKITRFHGNFLPAKGSLPLKKALGG